MNASVLVAFGGVFLFAAICGVVVWFLHWGSTQDAEDPSLETTLERIERDAHHARELLGVRK